MPTPRAKHKMSKTPLVATAITGAAGFAALTTLVAHRKTAHFDGGVRKRMAKRHARPAELAVKVLGYTGKSWVHGPAAALIANYIEHRGSLDGSRAINLASTLASSASKTFDWALKHRRPPPGRHSPKQQSFPSGHTLETAAVALVCAYVLWREGLADGRIAFPVAALIPLLEGSGRMYLDKHWATDVIAGMLGGVTVAAMCAAGYEARVG